jgi:ABC-type lipoprotein release transport system permease subunit
VINETLARRSFPGQNPLGHTIATAFDGIPPKPMTVVGVVADVRQRGPAREPDAEIYMPFAQHPGPSTQLRIVARTALKPEQLAEAFREKAREIAPEMPVKFSTMESRMAEIVSAPRFRTMLLSIFAALAVGLAMAGVYAVVSFMVTRRRGEIGLRMALGANAFDVQKMVLRQGIWMALAGLVLGIAGALAASHWLGSLLFGVRPTDPATYGAAAAVIVVVTLAASYVPARRAARVDPLVALRQD